MTTVNDKPLCPNNTLELNRFRHETLVFITSQGLNRSAMIGFVFAYVLLILIGAFGNALICFIVMRRPAMRKPLNILIANLAFSDLLLCVITQTFNIIKFCRLQWEFGNVMCKIVPLVAGTNVFVSTLTISAIALNRFIMIVYPMKGRLATDTVAYVTLVLVWVASLLLACPLLTLTGVTKFEPCVGMTLFEVCVENVDMRRERVTYSMASMLFQYLIPLAIIFITNSIICCKLRSRMSLRNRTRGSDRAINNVTSYTSVASSENIGRVMVSASSRIAAEQYRQRKTGILLFAVAGVFAACWLPLNVFNVIADVNEPLMLDVNRSKLVFPVCHLLVLLSACINPVLYGWLNSNFHDELARILCCCLPPKPDGATGTNDTTGNNLVAENRLCVVENKVHSQKNFSRC